MLLNRRHFTAGLLAVTASPAWARSTTAPRIARHEPTEIAWILAGMSNLARGGEALNRDTDYWRAAETWFEPFADHAGVVTLGAAFNLPRLIGKAANYDFDGCGHLVASAGSRPVWDDAAGDLFTAHRDKIEAFAREARARTYLAAQNAAFRTAQSTLAAAADLADMQTWPETQFTARPEPIQAYVSPVTGGWNFANPDVMRPRLWLPDIDPPTSDYTECTIVRGFFTETDHNYINPATARLDPDSFSFITEANGWATQPAWADYNTPELVVNEYLTDAAFLAYARDRLSGEDLENIEASTHRMMEQRGFPKFSAFSDTLHRPRDAQLMPFEALLPLVLHDYA